MKPFIKNLLKIFIKSFFQALLKFGDQTHSFLAPPPLLPQKIASYQSFLKHKILLQVSKQIKSNWNLQAVEHQKLQKWKKNWREILNFESIDCGWDLYLILLKKEARVESFYLRSTFISSFCDFFSRWKTKIVATATAAKPKTFLFIPSIYSTHPFQI